MPRRPPAFPVLKLGDEGVVDCCGDGSVLKLTKKAARARHVKSPVDGDECTTHKRGWLAANPCKEGEFEDSKEGGEPYQFLVGGGGAVKGLSDAVRRMRRGEVAYVWMAGHKGLGEEGNPPKIPKHAALCFELELLKFTDGKDVSPEMDGSVLTRRVTKGASRPRGFLSPHDKSTITFDFELWVTGTSDKPLDRPLANVGAVWYAHERERKPGYPKGLRVLLENVFQNDVVHAVMSKQAVEHYEGVDAIPEGGTLECLVKLRSWHEFIDCHERDPGMIRKEINKFAGASKWQIPAHADVVVVRGQVMVAGKSNTYAMTYGDMCDIRDPRVEHKTDDEKNDWVKAAPSTSWRLDEDDCGTPTGSYDDSEPYKPLCRGIDIAVRSMKMGERATVYIDRRYGYDDRDPHVEDCVPNCAKNVDLVATLEIHNLERLPEMWEIRNRAKLDHCDEFKKMGNRRYAAGDYARAIRRYDRAVETGSSDTYVTDDELKELRGKKVGVLLNRAAAHMKLKNYLLCRNDAREVLNHDPDSLKALFRMGHASMHLDNLDDARGALEKVLVLDPENRRARLDLELVDEKEQRARRKEKESFEGYLDPNE